MRKKYLYSSYSAPREYRGIDVVSDLFSDYYFGVRQTVDIFDAFLVMHLNLTSIFLVAFLFSIVMLSLKLFVISSMFSLSALVLFGVLIVKWLSFKHVFNDLKDNQIF